MKPGKDGILLENVEVNTLCLPGYGAVTYVWLVMGEKGFECLYFNRSEGVNLEGKTLEERWKAGKTVANRDGCTTVTNFLDGIKKGVADAKEGKVRPWSEIKKELGL